MLEKLRLGDFILVLVVGAIAAMLIVPLPTPLLDILLVCNLSFALLLLLISLYLPNSSALLSFPSILLLSTLFRLGLNVASARLILSQADAGRVIEAFGTFLIRGEVVVGLIIFGIVTAVNFIVIASGAARVSEVAARFTLESLPGKQLAIDSDMRSGLLSSEDARRRREDIRRESQLYGSMDGAMKFVQGDAIAGIIIVLANICGGMFMGLRDGLGFGEAIQIYTVLTVGDGLVTQIPSLLTSICAGIVVTRVSSSENTTLSADLGAQLFSQPAVLALVSSILLVISILPGVPTLPFLLVGLVGCGASFLLARTRYENSVTGSVRTDFASSGSTSQGSRVNEEEQHDDASCILTLDNAVLFRMYRQSAAKMRSRWHEFRDDFFEETGVKLPELIVTGSETLTPSSFDVSRRGLTLVSGRVRSDAELVEMHPIMAPLFGLEVLEEVDHPLAAQKVFWSPLTSGMASILDAGSVRKVDFLSFIHLQIGKYALENPDEFMTTTDVYSSLRQLEKRHPGLVGEGFGREFVSVARLTEVVHGLLDEGQSVRDFRGIAECVATYCAVHGVKVGDESTLDINEIVGFIRVARRRHVTGPLCLSGRRVRVVTVAEEVEDLLREEEESTDDQVRAGVDRSSFERLEKSLLEVVRPMKDFGVSPVALVVKPELRAQALRTVSRITKSMLVLTQDEIDHGIDVERVGTWAATAL